MASVPAAVSAGISVPAGKEQASRELVIRAVEAALLKLDREGIYLVNMMYRSGPIEEAAPRAVEAASPERLLPEGSVTFSVEVPESSPEESSSGASST